MKKITFFYLLNILCSTMSFSQSFKFIGVWCGDITVDNTNYFLELSVQDAWIYKSATLIVMRDNKIEETFNLSSPAAYSGDKYVGLTRDRVDETQKFLSDVPASKNGSNYPFNEGIIEVSHANGVLNCIWKVKKKKKLKFQLKKETNSEKTNREKRNQSQQEKQAQEQEEQRKIIESQAIDNAKNMNISAFLDNIENLSGGKNAHSETKKANARKYYYVFRSCELTPKNAYNLIMFKLDDPVYSFWKSDVIGEIRGIGRELTAKLTNIVSSKIQSKDVAYLEKMNREGFYFTDLSIADLQKAKEFCGNCAYITTALNTNLEAKKRADEQAAIAEQRRKEREWRNNTSSSSDNSSNSGTGGGCYEYLNEHEKWNDMVFSFGGNNYKPISSNLVYKFKCRSNGERGVFVNLVYNTETKSFWDNSDYEKGWYFYDSGMISTIRHGPYKTLNEAVKETCRCN